MAEALLEGLVPDQAGTLWIALLVMFVVFGDWRRPLSFDNLRLLLILMLAPLLVDILVLGESRYAGVIWAQILAVTAFYLVWALRLSRRPPPPTAVVVPRGGLRVLVLLLITLDAAVAFGRPPDDAGRYTNLGAQRWLETGTLPYGDAALRGPDSPGGGAAATYGPVLYAAHIPAQWLLERPRNPVGADPRTAAYVQPPPLATQLTCFALFLIGLGALFFAARREAGELVALGLVAVCASSPFVIGLGSDESVIGGLRYISHIGPTSLTLLAFALLSSPIAAGTMLGLATGALFYPVFLFPAWLGWYASRGWKPAARFAAGYAITGLVLGAIVLGFTRTGAEESAIALFFESTFGHQEGATTGQYGASRFGFWGAHPGWDAFWQRPLVGSSFAMRPIFLAYAALVLATFFMARGRSRLQLAALTAALAIGPQLWKTHGGGTYVAWYYPFLLLAVFAGAASLGTGAERIGAESVARNTGLPAGTAP